ncbi:site-specific integrase [Caballeronia sp. LZ033]|uniref:tyrosine-type recombinase/integrase n=1 Tax=Caballeronia sp. LZ033 TaxID=3038566 RepID=UPI00285FE2A6|nr:site-specific integrase [Caballeronia sp. LZ033]MDR5812054.1 site-specific integrase [Caballeronia sp. LZ033]
MASIYQEGAGWAVRNRSRHDTFYQSGFDSKAKATAWLRQREQAIQNRGKPYGLGPEKTTLAMALYDYTPERVPFLKSGDQLCRRLNRFIRFGRLPTYQPTRLDRRTQEARGCDTATVYFELTAVPYAVERVIPQGLDEHRAALAQRADTSERLRERLACTRVADITRHQIQEFMNVLREEGKAAQSITHEQAVLREFFNHARRHWNWSTPTENPATQLDMPVIDNARDRVLTPDEQARLQTELLACRNRYVAPFVGLLLETAMRQSELLLTAQWRDIDWKRRVLKLWDAKGGGRGVPLTQGALRILEALPRGADDDRVFPITLDALDSAWNRAIARAGIENFCKHDLRHCAMTRFAELLGGDIFLLKLFGGHKTLSQLARYVNPTAADALEAVDAAEAARNAHKAPLHARAPSRTPTVGDAVRALESAEGEASRTAPALPDVSAADALAPDAGAASDVFDASAAPGIAGPRAMQGGTAPLAEQGAAEVVSFAAWRARHAA